MVNYGDLDIEIMRKLDKMLETTSQANKMVKRQNEFCLGKEGELSGCVVTLYNSVLYKGRFLD